MKKINHHWVYCTLCSAPVVICGSCGNNSCNGGRGCKDCDSSWEYEKDRSTCPQEFIEREEREYTLSKKDIDFLKLELEKKDLKDWEIEFIKKEIDRNEE